MLSRNSNCSRVSTPSAKSGAFSHFPVLTSEVMIAPILPFLSKPSINFISSFKMSNGILFSVFSDDVPPPKPSRTIGYPAERSFFIVSISVVELSVKTVSVTSILRFRGSTLYLRAIALILSNIFGL